VKGKISVAPTITMVVNSRYFPGKLLKKGLRLRINIPQDKPIRKRKLQTSLNLHCEEKEGF
jgi:hypothetical protein